MAGLEISNLIIPNKELKKAYEGSLLKDGINKPNLLGLTAVKAGFDHCEQWLDELLLYIENNLDFVHEYLKKYLPNIKLIKSEGTFLAWLDLTALGLPPKTMEKLLLEKGKLLVNQGYTFGTGGEGFIRINVACPRSTLEEAMKRLYFAFKEEL
ncbi:Cystathionine beta-lyase PatB [bioreactor metagenome]|uniref:Cystathionine beta-lyase PatB n=2 Tax=root TaxID=1 RepID=A0A645IMP9_9ZZZZ